MGIDVSIIIINYKHHRMTFDAVDSIIKMSHDFSYEIIVVDNSADSIEISALKKGLEGKATVIDSKANLGFGRGNNLGASFAKGKYLYFINNDTLLLNNAIYELYSCMEKNEDFGVVGSNLYNKRKEPNHSFIPFEKNYYNDKKIISLWFILLSKFRRKRFDFNYSNKPKKLNGYVCGASFMIRKESFDIIGGFDKDIFMYAEESLLCYQVIHQLGLGVYNIPSSKIIHFEGSEMDNGVNKNRIKAFVNGNSIYYLKAFGKEVMIKYLIMMYKKYRQINRIKKILRMNTEESNAYMEAYLERYNEVNGE